MQVHLFEATVTMATSSGTYRAGVDFKLAVAERTRHEALIKATRTASRRAARHYGGRHIERVSINIVGVYDLD